MPAPRRCGGVAVCGGLLLAIAFVCCGGTAERDGSPATSRAGASSVTGQAGEAGGGSSDPFCPAGKVVSCIRPQTGEVIVDIDPPCAVVYDGASGRCLLRSRLPEEDQAKRCVNQEFWDQQARLFDTLSECEVRCLGLPASDAGCEKPL